MTQARGSAVDWRATRRVLLHGGRLLSPADADATALLIVGDTISWVGDESAAAGLVDSADEVIDLAGAYLTPGFVDAHVHATSAGLLLTGLDLTGCSSAEQLLAALADHARRHPGEQVIGHGWDQTRWPDATLPTRTQVDDAAHGASVYLSRIDAHSALVSSALCAHAADLHRLDGFTPDGSLSSTAHLRVREIALSLITDDQRRDAQRTMRAHAAALGIVAIHEMAGPAISSEQDLAMLLDLADAEPGPLVTGYWGELASRGGIGTALELGAAGVAGDLFVDGALGSHTACLHAGYRDLPDSTGASFLSVDEIADHLVEATRTGMQAGFHVIGDAACSAVSEGLRRAAAEVGSDAVRAAGHRIEHAEMLSDDDLATLADLGVVASMQPMFDALWGGTGGMYDQRLGDERMRGMNRFHDIADAGIRLAFGSDAPVTAMGPWLAVRAAVHHRTPGQGIPPRDAFDAHVRNGWLAAGIENVGELIPGQPAHLAVWAAGPLTDGLPDLDAAPPECLATLVHGRIVHDAGLRGGGR